MSGSAWNAAILVRYDVDFEKRTVSYYGCDGEEYVEAYARGGHRLASLKKFVHFFYQDPAFEAFEAFDGFDDLL